VVGRMAIPAGQLLGAHRRLTGDLPIPQRPFVVHLLDRGEEVDLPHQRLPKFRTYAAPFFDVSR
jgi:hypothetical protein